MANDRVLAAIADPAYQTELGQYNIELNVPPAAAARRLDLTELEAMLRASLDHAEAKANESGSEIIMIGILPTLMPEHFRGDWMSANPRYAALERSDLRARREDLELDITGRRSSLQMFADTIAPESACTSVQLHLQVAPADFAATWNAAQTLAGPQLALGANSPFLFGKRLWAETRTELFLQATDTRSPELRNQGVRPPVFFGERWITSIFDLFEENVRYFPALLPETTDEDPEAVLASGRAPRLQELRLHNGTVYRWNRPVYDVVDGVPHLRVENRVLPAGPTVVDVLANAAFYYGAVKMLCRRGPAGLDEDVVRRGQGELRRRRPARGRRRVLLARLRRGQLGRAAAAPPAADGRRGAGPVGRLDTTRGPAIWASSRSAASSGATAPGGRARRWAAGGRRDSPRTAR